MQTIKRIDPLSLAWIEAVFGLIFGIIMGIISSSSTRVLKPWITGGIIGVIFGVLYYLFSIFSANMDDPLIASWVHAVSQILIVILLILGIIIGFIAGKIKNRKI